MQENFGLSLPHNSLDLHQQQGELIYYVDNANTCD